MVLSSSFKGLRFQPAKLDPVDGWVDTGVWDKREIYQNIMII